MSHPDPDLLRTYVTILDTGSFTAAARKVHRTQSAVSMQMRRLESLLGSELFERASRKVKLTPDGEIFLDHARRILRQYVDALSALNQDDLGSEITIGVPDDYALTFLPEILDRLIQVFPSLRLTIVCEPSRRLSNLINEGSIDIALLTEGEGICGGVVLHREEIVWVTSAPTRPTREIRCRWLCSIRRCYAVGDTVPRRTRPTCPRVSVQLGFCRNQCRAGGRHSCRSNRAQQRPTGASHTGSRGGLSSTSPVRRHSAAIGARAEYPARPRC